VGVLHYTPFWSATPGSTRRSTRIRAQGVTPDRPTILTERETIKRQTIANGRLQHRLQAD
jgi:hypothetical protein